MKRASYILEKTTDNRALFSKVPALSRGGYMFLRIMVVAIIVAIALFVPADPPINHP